MNKYIKVMSAIFSLIPLQAVAAGDSGKIVEVYSHLNGSMAIRLDNGLPDANATNNCGTVGNEVAGVDSSAPSSIKAAILSAKATQSNVIIVTLGNCVGGWIKIEAMHTR